MSNRRYNKMDGVRPRAGGDIKRRSRRTRESQSSSVPRRSVSSRPRPKTKNDSVAINRVSERRGTRELDVPKLERRRTSHSRTPASYWPILRVLIPVVLGLLVPWWIIAQFDSVKARVQPYGKVIEVDTVLEAVAAGSSEDLPFSVIALTDSVQTPVEPDTQERVRERAQGEIKIFNDFSESPQRLSPETRFEAVDGKIFKLGDEEVIVPGRIGETPGEVTATVYADQPGSEYNIDPTDFSIPGFLELGLDEKYAGMYGLSTRAFDGGFTGTKPAVSDKQTQTVSDDLELKLTELLTERLLTEKTSEMLLVENSVSLVMQEPYFIQDEEGEGTLDQKGTMYALLVNREDLGEALAKEVLEVEQQVTLSSDTVVTPIYQGGDINYSNQETIDILVEGEVLFIWGIDIEMIAGALSGVTKDELAGFVENQASVGSITIKNHPRWRNTISENAENITVKLIQ